MLNILRTGSMESSGVITDWNARECDRIKNSDKDIAFVAVTDDKGLIYYHSDKKLLKTAYKPASDMVEKMYPIKSDKTQYGFLYIGVEKATINQKIHSFIIESALISLIILCLIIPLSYALISRKIVNPLKRITRMLTDIAEGEGGPKMP
ncbi:MAG TPA: hypothetical protein PLM71_07405 [Syntrophorhabdaceae bacterium]|nr:hypothetical protein [Syntrophorhabdaceae bacterium]